MELPSLLVRFVPNPLSFVRVPGSACLWDAPERFAIGVYLWCLPLEGGYLINYVGQTSSPSGFDGRLWTELKDWRKGRYTAAVDIEEFMRGRRVVLNTRDESEKARQLERQRKELESTWRILLAPLRDRGECVHVENTIVDRLRKDSATWQFVSNHNRGYNPASSPLVEFESVLPIIGLTAPVPRALAARCSGAAFSRGESGSKFG